MTEMHETPRLRDRGAKKDRDRDRDRFSRSKRRRIFHGDDADESSEESLDDEVDDDEAAVRHPSVNHPPVNHSAAAAQNHQHHSDRKGLVSRMPPWDEINLLVPRKARSKGATAKRIHEPWVSAGGCSGGGGGEQNQLQFSTSPSRLSPSASQISSNSNKMKSLGGTKKKKQQASSTAEELEVAELLTVLRTKEECSIRIDKIDDNDVKSSIRSPSSISQPAVQPQPANLGSNPLTAVAPKRKRPRQVSTVLGQPSTLASSSDKLVEDQPAQHEVCLPKFDMLAQPAQHEACLPKFDMLAPSPAIENGGTSHGFSSPQPISTPMVKQENEILARAEVKEEVSFPEKEMPPANVDKTMTEKISPVAKNLRKEKFTIDLMAPPEKMSPERDGLCDFSSEEIPVVQEFKPVSEYIDEANGVIRKFVKNGAEGLMNGGKAEKSEDFESKKQSKGKAIDLPIDLENADNMDIIKHEMPKQQSTSSRVDTQSDKTVPTSLSIPTTMAGWPGSFPQFGYMAQVPSLPSVMPSMDAATGSSSIRQAQPNIPPPPVKRNRCSKHFYIAQSIQYNQKIMQTNALWHASAGAAQLFVPKPPANVMPPLDPILGNPLQGGVSGRSLGSLQDTKVAPYFAAFTGQPSNASISNVNIAEAAHRTQLGLSQMPPQLPGLPNNMIPSPALFYPINQHQAMAAAAAAVRSGAAKSSTGVGAVAPSSGVSTSAVASSGGGGVAVAMNLGYSTEQYLAILQNSGYPIPLPAHLGGPPAYRGGMNPSLAMPPFSGPFYQSQMLHHSQLQPTSESTPQKPPHTQPGHPNTNTSTSTGSSSSQKQQQLQRGAGGGSNDAGTSSHGLPSQKQHHSRPIENEAGGEDGPASADSRVLQAQKSLYAHNMAMSIQSQNAAMLSTAAAASVLKHTQQQQSAMKGDLTPSQAFAMSYASNNGGASLSGMNYSTMAQGHALFQNLPDITRQGYQMNMAVAAAAAEAPMSAQQKKAHSQAIENGKSAESVLKSSGISGSQHLPSYAKPDNERPTSTSHGNSVVVESSSGAANSTVRTSNRSTNAAIGPTNTPLSTPNFQQFQLHRAQELQMQRLASAARAKSTSSNNAGVYSGATTAKFPQTVSGFSHGPTQSGSPTQPQWKTSGRASTPTPTATADQFTSRNQQLRSGLTSSHQANISFGANSMKSSLAGAHAGSGTANVYASSTAGVPAAPSHGSPSNSFSKSNGGSPRASASENQTTTASAAALPPQSYTKSSTSSSSRKSPPTENIPPNPSHTQQKQLQQMQPQYRMQSQQPTQKQTQFFFNGPGAYMQAQAPQSSSAAASIFYRQQLEQQQSSHQQQHQKQSSNPASAGLTLTSSSGASDPSKAGGAAATSNSMKGGMPPPGLLHAAHMAAASSGTAHPLMSAMFPYMSMPSAKPGDQKPATA